MSDPSQQQGQPSEEELQAYLEQLREAEPSEVLAQAYTMLGTGAEVKLGRSDARVLIDAMAALVDATGDRLQDDLAERMRNGVAQLQNAQFQLEQQSGETPQQPPQTTAPQPPPQAPGQGQPGAAQPGQQPGSGPQKGQQDESKTSRLWVPGRDPGAP